MLWPGAQDLLTVLDETLTHNGCKALLTLDDYTYALWKSQDLFWLFDSHSRNSKCKRVPDGKAFCGSYSSLKEVCLVIFQNIRDDKGKVKEHQFDVTPILVVEGSSNEFDGSAVERNNEALHSTNPTVSEESMAADSGNLSLETSVCDDANSSSSDTSSCDTSEIPT